MRTSIHLLSFLLALILAGCPDDPACDDGLVVDDAGSCVLPTAESCSEDTLAVLGEPQCLPVGWTDCGEAFAASDDGCIDACPQAGEDSAACRAAGDLVCPEGFSAASPGCAPILAASACAGATRATLGAPECEPIGDCEAPFPPAAATLFVDAAFTDDELGPTHHRTVSAALAAATIDDVIAIEAGTYAESLVLPARVSLVGRCAAEVTLMGPGNPGVSVSSREGVSLSGLTIRGFDVAVEAEHGSKITLEDVLLVENRTVGVFVLDADTEVTIRRSAVRDTLPDGGSFGTAVGVGFGGHLILEDSTLSGSQDMGILVDGSGSRATLRRSAVVDTQGRPAGTLGWGIAIQDGGHASLTDSLVRHSRNVGVNVVGAGSQLQVSGSVVEETAPGGDLAGIGIGIGISVQLGAALALERSTLRHNAVYGLRVGETGTTADIAGLVVDGVLASSDGVLSVGVQVENGAEVDLTESFLQNPEAVGGPLAIGLIAQNGGIARVFDVAIVGAAAAGIAVDGTGTHVQAKRLLVRDVATSDPDFGYGVAVSRSGLFEAEGLGLLRTRSSALFVEDATAALRHASIQDTAVSATGRGRGVTAQHRAQLTLEESLLAGNVQVGVVLFGEGTLAVLSGSAVRGTRIDPAGEHGHGVEVLQDAVVRVERSELRDNEGVGAIFASAAGSLELSRVLDNRVGIHAFDGSTLREQAEAPDAIPALSVVITESEFSGNETRVGSGAVPLPEPEPRPSATE